MAGAVAATLVACATAKTPAPHVDPVALRKRVADTLARDARVAADTRVDVNSRTVVILSGRVASKEEREVAGKLACSVEGVSVVYNELKVESTIR
jgi:osmotically-inducible protein OsmY